MSRAQVREGELRRALACRAALAAVSESGIGAPRIKLVRDTGGAREERGGRAEAVRSLAGSLYGDAEG